MTSGHDHPHGEPTLSGALRQDLRQRNFWRTLRREFVELREFSLDGEKRARLTAMGTIRRHLVVLWWILKGMILKLTPTRRLVLVAGVILTLIGKITMGSNVTFESPGGTILILFVLLLELKDRILSQDELRAGRAVQHALLPELSPEIAGWSVYISTSAANEVGGDLVDYLRVSPERNGLVIADVSGKGLRAALLMAKLQTIIRSFAPDFTTLDPFVSKVNDVFRRDCPPNFFASMIYLEIAPLHRSVSFVNAGHLPPLIIAADGVHQMEKGETALGLLPEARYKTHELSLQQGDVLLCYSDGLTEARNQHGDFFGVDRLLTVIGTLRELPAPGIAGAILAEVSRFVGDARPHDDLSLVVMKAL